MALAGGCASGKVLKAPPNGRMPVAVESLDEGRIRLKKAGRKLVVDLSPEISGCTGRVYDLTVKEEWEARVGFEIVDETEKAGYTYIVLLATAPPNCNVQGHCGTAEPDSTLIWLKLAEDLSLAGTQSFAIENCRAVRFVKREDDSYEAVQAKDLSWTNDILQVDFEEEYSEPSTWRLTYDRREPELGLQKAQVRISLAGNSTPRVGQSLAREVL